MIRKIKKFIAPAAVLFAVNCLFSWQIFLNDGFNEKFKGYALGTVLAALFVFSWIFIAKKVITAAPIKMFKIIAAGFMIKLAVLCAVLYWGWNIPFSFIYLGAAFAIGVFGSFLLGILLLKKDRAL